jgi:myo-inositol 2-dehydrogenase / D-chiro-inositol 1-dehydrogenase
VVLKVGIIGTGNIGSDHARRLAWRVSGAEVSAVFDVDTARAQALAAEVGAVALGQATDVIDDPSVDAVVIASPGETHADLVLRTLAAAKPALCEKPLATTTDACLKILEAEADLGRRLIQVGFMRRYDSGYAAVKAALVDGSVGEPLLAHFVHRNAAVPDTFTTEMAMNDSLIHEFDVARWLFGQEIVAATVVPSRPSPLAWPHLRDPQLVLLHLADGGLVEAEVFVSCRYGYDVRCEVVGSTGVVLLETPTASAALRNGRRESPVPADWRVRFGAAYLVELQEWVDGVRRGVVSGPSAWDGYAATAVAESCVASLASGRAVEVGLVARPPLYA